MSKLYTIRLLKRAKKELASLPMREQKRIARRVDALAQEPRPPGCVALKAPWQGHYRIRAGNYRILYQVRDAQLIVLVVRVADRKEAY